MESSRGNTGHHSNLDRGVGDHIALRGVMQSRDVVMFKVIGGGEGR